MRGSRKNSVTAGCVVKEYTAIHMISDKKYSEWETIFQAIGHPAIILDSAHKVLSANNASIRLTGKSALEIVGKQCYEMFHGEDVTAPPKDCPMEKLLRSGLTESVDMEMESLGGIFLVSCTPVFDKQGNLEKVIHIATDITERKQAEEKLLASRQELLEAQRIAHLGSWDLDLQTGKGNWSDESYRIFGFEPGAFEPTFNRFMDSVHPEDRKTVEGYFPDMLSGKLSPVALDLRIIRPSGEERIINVKLEVITDRNGKPLKLTGISLDITERKRAEEALRESQRCLETAVEIAPVVLWNVDSEGALLLSEGSALSRLGLKTEGRIGESVFELYKNYPEVLAPIRRGLAGDEFSAETQAWGRHWTNHYVPRLDERGNVIGLVGVSMDITERKQAENIIKAEYSFKSGVIANAAEGICVCHEVPEYPYVKFTIWNEYMTLITGYTMEEINRSGWYQTVYPDPDTSARAAERMGRMRYGDNLKAEEWDITRMDGVKRTISISTSVLSVSETEHHVLALMSDITERKTVEDALRQSEARFRDLAECLPTSVFEMDLQGRFTFLNSAALDNLGYSLQDIEAGLNVMQVLVPEDREHAGRRYCPRF